MKDKLKVHPIDIPKEIIGWFFTKAHRFKVEVELVNVVEMNRLRVDILYYNNKRVEVMKLIEGVDQFFWDEEERKLQESKTDSHV